MEAPGCEGDAAMMPPTNVIDMIRTINQELDRERARYALEQQGLVTRAPAEARRSRLSRLIVWAGVRQQQPGV